MANTANILISLAAVCALCVAGHSARAAAAVVTVTNCNDSGSGSLRSAISLAASGDVVDAGALTCATIPLVEQLHVPQENLTIKGPVTHRLTIDGGRRDRLIEHTGHGTLSLQRLWLVQGREYVQNALGGCIRSLGNVSLRYVHMHFCQAEGRRPPDYDGVGAGAFAAGGAIHAVGNVTLSFSQIHGSYASTFTGNGGGIFSSAAVTLYRSRIFGNDAHDGGGISARDVRVTDSLIDHNAATEWAGIRAFGEAFVLRSTIADNDALEVCGGLCVVGHTRLVDSTLSRNGALTGSAAAFEGDAAIYNSTIAANRQGIDSNGCGVAISALDGPYTLHLESSIVTVNRCRDGSAMPDIGGTSGPITGSHNIVRSASASLPADTSHMNPKLYALADNGGPTPTMALPSCSVAINHGANPLGLTLDQRGDGFPRVSGATADIGAFEFRQP